MPELKKILVIRFSSFGDIVLSFPLLKKLKTVYPQTEIHFLTSQKYKDVVKLSPAVERIILFNESLSQIREAVLDNKYSLIIDLHKNLRSYYVTLFNQARTVRYKKDNFKKFLLVKFKLNLFREVIPVYKKYLKSVKNVIEFNDYSFEADKLIFTKDKIIDGDYTVISPSSRHFTKTYPTEKFIEFINEHPGKKFVLTGDDSEKDNSVCDYISGKCSNVMNMCGKLNIIALTNVLYNSDSVICNDSAVLHLAEAAGKNVKALFGCTVKEFGFFPQLEKSVVFENNNLKCRPCTHIGKDYCKRGDLKCMDLNII